MKAQIYYFGDPSVGIWSGTFEMEVPDLSCYDEKEREVMRKDIEKFYTQWLDEKVIIWFDDECSECRWREGKHSPLCPTQQGEY